MIQRCLNNTSTIFVAFVIIAATIIMGCIGEEEKPKPKNEIEVTGLDNALKALYNRTHYYNFSVKSHLPKDCVINISDMKWEDILIEGAKSPETVFYVDEPISTNGTERKYIGNSSARAFLPSKGSINITMTLKNIDQNFRSGTLTFKILAFYAGGEKAASKDVKVQVRYM